MPVWRLSDFLSPDKALLNIQQQQKLLVEQNYASEILFV